MTRVLSTPQSVSGSSSRLAIFTVFVLDGVGFGAWAALLPSFKTQLALTDSQLSIPLFAMVVGSLLSMPMAGRRLMRRGSREVVLASIIGYSCVLPLIAASAIQAAGVTFFTVAALVFGAMKGALDVSGNAQAIEVERAEGRPIVSTCHGGWSLGVLFGSAFVALALKAHISPLLATSLVSALMLGFLGAVASRLARNDHGDPASIESTGLWPQGRLLPLATLAFLALFCEGVMSDWSAIYLADEVGVSDSTAALGYAAYALAMTIGRFSGDRMAEWFGSPALLRASGVLIAAGLTSSLAVQTYPAALSGFALAGLGLANMIPVIVRSAGRGPNPGAAIASVSTVGYLGFLIGPPVIGSLSKLVGLPHALSVVVAFGIVIAGCARFASDDSG